MKRRQTILALVVLISAATAVPAQAHYLWVAIDSAAKPAGAANIYFEEGPAPGDGHYLDPIASSQKTWIRTYEQPKPQALKVTQAKKPSQRWLTAALPDKAPRSIDCYAKFGVYRYGETDVLLHYWARNLDVSSHEALHELGESPQMRLNLVPHDHEQVMEVTVVWEGKPAAGRMVHVRGPKGFRKNLKSNSKGRIEFSPKVAGRYTMRTYIELPKSGEAGGKSYSLIRHHGTLTMQLPLKN